jgi:hypothetical protein
MGDRFGSIPVRRNLSRRQARLRNWEQNRFGIDPAVQALLLVLYREPQAALLALHHAA